MLKKSEGHDPNYLAEIITIKEILPHPNADKLSLVEVFGNTIIIAKDTYSVGEKVIYFPVESSINLEFLSWGNMLDKPEMNSDGKTKGFFGKHGRVKAISLRGIPSQGFLFKTSKAAEFFGISDDKFVVGEQFDIIGEKQICKKYLKGNTSKQGATKSIKKAPRWVEKLIDVLPRPIRKKVYPILNAWINKGNEGITSRMIEGQFKLHYSTEQLGRNVWFVKPDDLVSITSKMHGTSAVFANVLCKPKFSFFKSKEPAYTFIYSSRNVIKNRKNGEYSDDVWGKWAEKIEGKLPEGVTIYGEIVGWINSSKMVQSNYDYGITRGESEFYIYRITHTSPTGEVTEFPWEKIKEFCKIKGFNYVPEYYVGAAKDLFNIEIDEKWNEIFLANLKEKYLDKPCEFCSTGVINEGIVLKINSNPKCPVFKFKSPLFLNAESADRDAGIENIEEEN